MSELGESHLGACLSYHVHLEVSKTAPWARQLLHLTPFARYLDYIFDPLERFDPVANAEILRNAHFTVRSKRLTVQDLSIGDPCTILKTLIMFALSILHLQHTCADEHTYALSRSALLLGQT